MNLKKKDLVTILNLFALLSNSESSVNFSVTVYKNKKLIEESLVDLKDLYVPCPQFIDYEKKRQNLLTRYCQYDNNGRPIINNGEFMIKDNLQDEFSEKVDKLKSSYKEVIDEQMEKVQALQDKLEEEIEIALYQFRLEDLPKVVTPSIIEAFYVCNLIDES
jgi:hypothetical protein